MAANDFLPMEAIRSFVQLKGGRVTNHELVNNFRGVLNDPMTKNYARQQFKEYVNTLATVKQIDGVKYLILKTEYYDKNEVYVDDYSEQDVYSDSPVMSPMTFRSPVADPEPSLDTSLPPLTQLRSRTFFEEVCQAVQLQKSPITHSESTPSPHLHSSPNAPLTYTSPHQQEEVDQEVELIRKLSSEFLGAPSMQDNFPDRPPRKKSFKNNESRDNYPAPQVSMQSKETATDKENIPIKEDSSDVLSPISVRERAQKINRIASETELKLGNNKQCDKSKGDDEDSSSVSSLDPIHKEWTLASSKCDYNLLLRLLKNESKLARARDYVSGYTALHWGAKHGNLDIIKLIAGRYGVNPNIRSNGGYTPLHVAAMHGHKHVMDLLIDSYGADCNIRDYSGKKPRQYMDNVETITSEQVRKICTEAHNRKNAEKETASFLRIGSLNVKVQKTISSISLKNSQNKSWGSADNLQELLEKQQMPAPKFVPVKRNKSKKLQRYSHYLESNSDLASGNYKEEKKSQPKTKRRSSFHNS